MRRYDTTFIINPQIGDEQINARINEVTSVITGGSGNVLKEDRIGNRRLAYEIDRQTHGYYVCLIHESDADVLARLDRLFTLGDDFLRHLTIQFDGEPDRKNITEVMMGYESERAERREEAESGRRERRRDERPAPRESAKTEPESKQPAATAEAKTESVAPAEAAPVADTKPAAQTDEETL